MYKCKHFKIQELVPPEVYKDRGDKAWYLLDDRALETLDTLREHFGPTTVNNWLWEGRRMNSGLRTCDSKYGTQYSQHRFGRAFDPIFKGIDTEEVREYVLSHQDEFPHIRGLELKVAWLHFDIGNRPGDDIYTFNP